MPSLLHLIKPWARHIGVTAAALLLAAAPPAHAEHHALIMWIGQYADPRANLPGIDLDAKAARGIATAMGVPPANITEMKNAELSWTAMSAAISSLATRIQPGDKVFLYYSGHGGQQVNAAGGGRPCSEGLVAHDVQLLLDSELEVQLAKLAARASQVVVMNDSCFSGGAITKDPFSRWKPKRYPDLVGKPAAASTAPYQCGDATNKSLTKALAVVPREGARLLYVAASADNEVSYAGPEGSVATQAWSQCLKDAATDADGSGSISGEELRACAQARIDGNRQGMRQRITLQGVPTLAFAAAPARAGGQVALDRALRDLHAGADAAITVALRPRATQLRIGQDYFAFDLETNRDGYLYLFQVAGNGQSMQILFPNGIDADNRIAAGRHSFPRASWALKSGGPAGTTHVMALLSPEPKDFSRIARPAGVFATVPAKQPATKELVLVATGAGSSQQGRYGASDVIPLVEAP